MSKSKTVPIELTDNNRFLPNKKASDGDANVFEFGMELNLLVKKFNGIHVGELCQSHGALLAFPQDVQGTEDDPVVFDSYEFEETVDGKTKTLVRFRTDNIMGFVGTRDEKGKTQYLKISSRFDKSGKDYFLQYLLLKVFNFNIFKDLDFTKDTQVMAFDWLMMMFPHYLKKAYAQGLFRAYKTFRHNDSNVHGVIDVPRHIRKNVPFQGRIAYNTREYTRDNPLMQLVRHTIECLDRHKTGKDVLRADQDTREAVDVIRQYTLYIPNDLQLVISQNSKPVIHPFYTAYADLQNICLKILRHERIGYGDNKNDETVFGMLFDGAWLWEEYLNTILKNMGFTHPQNKVKTGSIRLFSEESPLQHNLYPDFYNEMKRVVLDAKYKDFHKRLTYSGGWDSGIREDVFQVITYMHRQKYEVGGFLYPSRCDEENGHFPLEGGVGSIYTIPFHVPTESTDNWKAFCQAMHKEEENFKAAIKKLL